MMAINRDSVAGSTIAVLGDLHRWRRRSQNFLTVLPGLLSAVVGNKMLIATDRDVPPTERSGAGFVARLSSVSCAEISNCTAASKSVV